MWWYCKSFILTMITWHCLAHLMRRSRRLENSQCATFSTMKRKWVFLTFFLLFIHFKLCSFQNKKTRGKHLSSGKTVRRRTLQAVQEPLLHSHIVFSVHWNLYSIPLACVRRAPPTFNDPPVGLPTQHLVPIHLVLLVRSHHGKGNAFLRSRREERV